MTPPMTPREKVAELIYDRLGIGSENQSVEQVSVDILTALASGSGDHAELARLAKADVRSSPVGTYRHDRVLALLAENAALRSRIDTVLQGECECCVLTRAQCSDTIAEVEIGRTEAERKLAEAVGVLSEIAKGEAPPEQHGHYLAHRKAVDAARNFLSKEPA